MTGYVVICYALTGEHLPALRERIRLISNGILRAGLRTYAHIRDEQQWNTGGSAPRQVLDRVFHEIADAEAVLLDLTGDAGSKRVGLNIEAGYAKALDKTIFALWRVPERPHMTTDLADFEDSYEHDGEIEEVIYRRFAEWTTQREAHERRGRAVGSLGGGG